MKVLKYMAIGIGSIVVVIIATPLLIFLGRQKNPPPIEVVFEDGYYSRDPNVDVYGDE